jgi:hypothetical protein
MADINQSTEELARLMEEAGRQMQNYGSVTKQTESEIFDVKVKQKTGIVNATLALNKFGEATGSVAKAAMSAASALHQGQKGAAAMNGAVDGVADAAKHASIALLAMVPGGIIIKALTVAVTAAIGAVAAYTKAANEMSDTLNKGYQGLAKSGAAASDGMTGLFRDAKKLGVSMNELDGYVQLIGENSKDLALFSGSVANGRKRFADLGKEMEPFRAGLLNAGMSLEEQREATMGYLRLQSRVGQTQNKTTEELAAGARRYLLEQDALTKLTGMTRKEQEDAREEIRSQERFAATLAEMRAKGQHNEAKALEDTYLVLRSQSKEAAQGFADVSTGMLTTEAAQKSYLATQGESMRVSQQIQAGQLSAAQGAQRVAKAHGATADAMAPLAKMGIYGETFGDYAADLRLKGMAEADIEKQLAKIKEDQIKQGATGGKAADAATQAQTDLQLAQVAATNATEEFVFRGVVPATKAMEAFAKVTAAAAGMANDATTSKPKKPVTAEEANLGAGEFAGMEGQFSGRAGGSLGATGKLIEDFGSGTPMMLHGREGVITEAQLNSLIKSASSLASGGMSSPGAKSGSGTASGPAGNQMSELQNFQTEMLKDTENLAKLTDADLRRTRTFSRTSLKLTDLKTQLMEDEIELLEEQNKMLADMEEIYSKTLGPEAAKAAVKAFKKTQMFGNMAAPAGAGGASSGMPAPAARGPGAAAGASGGAPAASAMPSGPSAPSEVEGARGSGPTAEAADVLKFTARSGSAEAFEGLNDRLKKSVILAAEEYHAATGNKMQVNSAKRDPADQQRLWEESVALGTPGKGPSGMAVARPGRSPHEHGLAVDIQNYNDSAAVAAMNRQGLTQKVPGDPVHFSFADGGVANGPTSGYLAELHGPEAVVPLPDGKTIPVRIEGGDAGGAKSKDMADMMNQFRLSMESMINQMNNRDLLNMMDEMVRAQKDSNDIQKKLLQAAAN